MSTVLQVALLGLGVGALYALTAQGLLIVYRGSGVLNFAHGAFGMAAAFVTWDFNVHHGVPYLLAALVAVGFAALLGAATHLLIMRNLRTASPLARTVATLGVLIVVQSVATLVYGTNTQVVPSWLPTTPIHVAGSITMTADRLILLGLGFVGAAVLWAVYRYTRFGMSTTAVAENQRIAASIGLSSDKIATINWALGSALGGVAAILITPIVQLQVTTMTNLMLAALAVALIANFVSFPVSLAAGLVVGVMQAELVRYVTINGISDSVPFGVIIIVVVVGGRSLPLRDFFLQRLPAVGSGRIRPLLVLLGVAICVLLITTLSVNWQDAMTTSFGMALVLLSLVVLTGYAGQISLGQFAIAGVGAYIAGRMSATLGTPFIPALLIGVCGAIPIGMLFALPAVRTRGVNLAIVTLGLGSAIYLIVFNSGPLTGGLSGTVVRSPSLFGFSIDPIIHPQRYALFAVGLFTIMALLAANVRRGRSGRRMIAVRTNERAAASLGVNVVTAKLYAFGLAAAIAAAGGIVLAFSSTAVTYTNFDPFTSISALAWACIGGIGFIGGAVFGALFFAPGALGAQASDAWLPGLTRYLPLIGGLTLIIAVLANQDGYVKNLIGQVLGVVSRVRPRLPFLSESKATEVSLPDVAEDGRVERVEPLSLQVDGLSVSYGPVVAVSDVSFTVSPGKILGLIGPNGAGKTTLIDAVTGFTALKAGTVRLGSRDLTSRSVVSRARAGLSRSFQSLELFEDMTVLDNLRAAADPQDVRSYVSDPFVPRNPPLPAELVAAIREFDLEADLRRAVEDLPYGRRRLLAIARAVATKPSILLLDEPAAGLGDHESAELAHLVRRLADDWGIGILLVEHDMNFVMSVCDEVAVLDFGRRISLGLPDEIRNDPAVIAAYLGADDGSADESARPPRDQTSLRR